MIYPEYMVEKYKVVEAVNDAMDKKLAAPDGYTLDELLELEECVDLLICGILEDAALYAAETGADRDDGYDPDRVIDDIEAQIKLGS